MPQHRHGSTLGRSRRLIVDLAAVGPDNTICILEVKVSLADFSRDDHTPRDLSRLRDKVGALLNRLKLTERISNQAAAYAKATKPEAWQEFNTYRWALADHEKLLREQRTFQKWVAIYSINFYNSGIN